MTTATIASERFTLRDFGRLTLPSMLTGSSVYGADGCVPNDIDYLVIGGCHELNSLLNDGWDVGGSVCEDEYHLRTGGFASVVKGRENVILAMDYDFLNYWVAAHDECLAKRPATKHERVAIFDKHYAALQDLRAERRRASNGGMPF